ncbi:S-layer homology domain-containing protein [Intestinibacillus sp. Marseille-P6563]|uniref:S-layer homology domain-containing protein n=1 Tax=Intestinibacillus sp. Marseille-P6563 TaxID=2364792 RepID=UPI000F071478|nr:S-layer homology domain-containing protein [Intestinibacillus sp. Marseille-P6563]
MAFTMMATAGAAYTDQADIQATEAVEMLSALGIMSGDGDGSFRPNDTITRAEACRMIYSIRTNSDDASAYADMQTTFTDVPADAWYAGYVKHCQAAGIVSGKSATIFDPNSNVTGVELALMCLRVIGYDPARADIGGSTWSTKTISLATEAGILKNVNTTITADCPRQWAAQLMYNTIGANTVEWSTDRDGYSDKNDNGGDLDTVGVKYLKLYTNVGTLTSINGQNLSISQTDSDKADSDTTHVDFTKLSQDYSSLLGRKVKVMFRDEKTNDVIGVYPAESTVVYETYLNATELDGDKIKFDGKSYTIDDADSAAGVQINVIKDGATATKENISYFADTASNKVSMNTVTFVDQDENGKIDTAIVTTYTGGEVTYVGSDKITFDGKTYDMSDDNIDEELVKDDYAVLSKNLYDDCNEIVRADILTTELTGYKEKDGYVQYELDGSWYNMAAEDTDVTTGDTVKAYVYNGVVLDLDTDDGTGAVPSNIAVVVGKGTSGLDGDQVKLRYFDGTTKTVTIADDSDVTPVVGRAYKVSGSDSDMNFEHTKANTKYNGFTATIGSETAAGNIAPDDDMINGVKVADDAVVILWAGNGVSKEISGKQYNALSNSTDGLAGTTGVATSVFTKETSGLTRVRLAAIQVSSTDLIGESSDNYGYIVTDGSRTSNGNVKYTIWTGSENVTVTEDTSYSKGDRVKGMLVGYSSISDGVINDVKAYGTIEKAKDAVSNMNNSDMYRGGNESNASGYIAIDNIQLNVTADTTVLLVDSKASDDNKIGLNYTYGDKLPQASKYKEGDVDKYLVNAFWIMDENGSSDGSDDTDIEVLVIDSTGAFDGFELDDVNAPKITAAEKSGNAESMKFGDSTVTLTYTATAVNYASDAAKQTLTATVSGGDDNTTGITNGTVDFEVKNNGSQDVTVQFDATANIDTYTITVKAGDTVLLTDTFAVLPKDASTSAAPTFSGTVTGDTTKVKEIDASMFTAGDSSYTVTSVKITVDDVEMTSGSDLLYVIPSGSTVTADVTVTAAENYTFPNGASTYVFEDVEVTVS